LRFYHQGKLVAFEDVTIQINVRTGLPESTVTMCDIGAGLTEDSSAMLTTNDNSLQYLGAFVVNQSLPLFIALTDIQQEIQRKSGRVAKLKLQGTGNRPGQMVYDLTFPSKDEGEECDST
jgi:hypothetical protein